MTKFQRKQHKCSARKSRFNQQIILLLRSFHKNTEKSINLEIAKKVPIKKPKLSMQTSYY